MIAKLAASVMRRPRHITLIFHRVLNESDMMRPTEPTAEWFRRLIRMLSANFEVIGLAEAVRRAASGELSGRSLSITFDDGYADNFLVALPILEEFGAPATFFVASAFVDGGRMWNDSIIEVMRRLESGGHDISGFDGGPVVISDWDSRRRAASALITAWKHLVPEKRDAHVAALCAQIADLPDNLMMTRNQLRRLAASPVATVGGHTRTHPILASLPESRARQEIEGGKHDLEDWIQREITLFAYPNGKAGRDYRPEHAVLAAQAGFDAAVATDWGNLDGATDRYAIPRFTPWHPNLARFSLDLLRCHFGLI